MTDHLSRIVFAQYGSIGCWTTTCRLRPLCELCPKLRPTFDLTEVIAESSPPLSKLGNP
jgi:hypothetical protein